MTPKLTPSQLAHVYVKLNDVIFCEVPANRKLWPKAQRYVWNGKEMVPIEQPIYEKERMEK